MPVALSTCPKDWEMAPYRVGEREIWLNSYPNGVILKFLLYVTLCNYGKDQMHSYKRNIAAALSTCPKNQRMAPYREK
jgi:hypothetical protein